MKKITLAIASIFALSGSMTAQEFAPVGANWYYSNADYQIIDNGDDYEITKVHYTKFEVSEELEYQGQTCKKIMEIDSDGNESLYKYTYEENNKLYYYEESTSSWEMVVDFSLEVDDTFNMDFPLANTMEGEDIVVMKVLEKETITIEGEERIKMKIQGKWLDVENYPDDGYGIYYTGTYISGLGATIEEPLFLDEDSSEIADDFNPIINKPIRCYSDASINYTNAHDYYLDFTFDGSDCEAKVLDVDDFSENSFNINAYPNPVENFIQINTTEKFSYEIFDIKGKSILKGSANPQENIHLDKIEKGMYFMNIITSNKSGTIKILKK
ncbi:T9SS type A sorting domain-containing protein [Aureivirga sp. CE67]|uniref:T9SS type A sorting domain-containing protein n=1 Tax=Aureivirga sp. CE67 TaxID=1788983 RepID=UPI0018CAC6B0|nr:T9SS type A sorting domain-containing protein [Aureivirga sp. CE67]